MWGWIKHGLSVGFHSILLWLDAIVYEIVARMYDIFVLLARTNIFEDEFYRNFSQRIYAILGVVMLFVLAYALLKALVDPEQLTKGDKGISKMVPTFVTSLVICGLLPSIFDFAYNVQNFILEENTIGILVLGTGKVANNESIQDDFGKKLAYTALRAFLNAEESECNFGEYTCESIENAIQQSPSNFMLIGNMTDAIVDGKVTYRWGFSTGVGLFLIYVLATFCLDLAVRSVRLAFLQLMAPIPVLMRVMPTKNDVFKKWLQKTIACFTEVFVRVFIMYMVVYFISNFQINWISGAGWTGIVANILVIMGILMFAKELPKLLSDITGIDSGNIKLGVKDFFGKLASGSALFGLAGAGITSTVRNAVHARKNFMEAQGGWDKFKALGRGVGSTLTGGFLGATRGFYRTWDAKNLSDVRKGTATAIKTTTDNRDRREAYKAAHGNSWKGVLGGHIKDSFTTAAEWAQGGFEAEEAKVKYYNDLLAARDKAKTATEALMNKNLNNAAIVDQSMKFKGTNEQVEAYKKLFDKYKNESISTMENVLNSLKNTEIKRSDFVRNTGMKDANGDDITRFDQVAYEKALTEHNRNVANMDNMVNQVKKSAIKKLQTTVYASDDVLIQMGFVDSEGNADRNKFSGIRAEIDDINNMLEAHGDAKISSSNTGAVLDSRMTDYENIRNSKNAEIQKKKRAREARNQKSGGSDSK